MWQLAPKKSRDVFNSDSAMFLSAKETPLQSSLVSVSPRGGARSHLTLLHEKVIEMKFAANMHDRRKS